MNFISKLPLKKKKIGACVFWAPCFSKFFGGKFATVTDFIYRLKNYACVLKEPIFFLSFLAGKFKMFKQPIP